MVRHARLDDHPDAIFGLMIGTLAVLMTVLVFFVYERAQEASKHSHGAPMQQQVAHPQR